MANKCGICGADINLMQTQKLADGNCICRKNCRSRGFKVYDYVHGNLPGVKAHLAQVERGTKLWEHYFVPRLKTKDKSQKLTRFGARRAEAHTVNHIVKTAFEEGKQRFAGVALTAGGFGVVTAELTFENAVGALHLLLFTQLRAVVGETLTARLAVLTRLDFCILDLGVKGTASALQIEVGTLAARELQLGTEISCHFLCYLFYPAALTAFSSRST